MLPAAWQASKSRGKVWGQRLTLYLESLQTQEDNGLVSQRTMSENSGFFYVKGEEVIFTSLLGLESFVLQLSAKVWSQFL